MAQALAKQRFCTLTHYVQLSADSVLVLHVHTLPENEDGTGSAVPRTTSYGLPPPFSWLEERHMQELLVMVHEAVHSKALKGLTETQPSKKTTSSAAGSLDLELKRGRNVRALLNFKSHFVSQHIVLPTDPSSSPLLPVFVTDKGRMVFESTHISTAGSGFRPFRAVQDSLHVFVDQYEPTSPHGVVKIMMLLDPSRKPSQDVLTFFMQPRKREGSSSDGEEGAEGGGLAELPVEGLKRRRKGGQSRKGRMTRRKAGNEKKSSKTKAKGKNEQVASRGYPQPTIIQSLANAASVRSTMTAQPLQKEAPVRRRSSPSIDELFGMGSEWLSEGEEQEKPSDQCGSLSSSSSTCIGTPACSAASETVISIPSCTQTVFEECFSISDSVVESVGTTLPPGGRVPGEGGAMGVEGWEEVESEDGREGEVESEDVREGEVESEDVREGDVESEDVREGDVESEDGREGEMESEDVREGEVESEDRREGEVWSSEGKEEEYWANTIVLGQYVREGESSQAELIESNSQPLDNITNVFNDLQSRKKNKDTLSTSRKMFKDYSTADSTEDTRTVETSTIDLTGEVVSIVLSSDEDSVASSQQHSLEQESREAGGKKKKRKKKIVSPQILFRGTKKLCDVPEVRVRRWLSQQKQLLIDIFQRSVYSRRHEVFITGARNRATLHHQISTRLFSKEQVDAITNGLMTAFCHKHMNYFSYVMSVLYPECLVRLIMDYHSVSFQQAERMMMGLDDLDMESCTL